MFILFSSRNFSYQNKNKIKIVPKDDDAAKQKNTRNLCIQELHTLCRKAASD